MPSNPRSRPSFNVGQNRMAPAPPGNRPLLPPHPKAPRTLPIDDFIQVSDAARAEMGEEVITDLSSFLDRAGFTQTSGSFRITEGGVELASVPRQSINGQINVYIGSKSDDIVKEELTRGSSMAYGTALGEKAPRGIESTAGISEGAGKKNIVARTVDLTSEESSQSSLKSLGIITHELTHEVDRAAGGATESFASIQGKTLYFSIEGQVNAAKKAVERGEFATFDEAFRGLGDGSIFDEISEAGRRLGTVEALGDTGQISAFRRAIDQDPEMVRRLGISDSGRATYSTLGIDQERTLMSDVVDRYSGKQASARSDSLTSSYVLGDFGNAPTQKKSGGSTMADLMRQAGASDELIQEVDATYRVSATATYSARVGGVAQGSVEEEILAGSTEIRGRNSYKNRGYSDELTGKMEGLYDRVREQELPKGRFDVEVVDDVIDDVSEIVSQAGVKPEPEQKPRIRLAAKKIEDSFDEPYFTSLAEDTEVPKLGARVSTAVDSSLDDAAEAVARRVPPQPILEVGSGKASRKTLERIVESGMTAKRVIKSIF